MASLSGHAPVTESAATWRVHQQPKSTLAFTATSQSRLRKDNLARRPAGCQLTGFRKPSASPVSLRRLRPGCVVASAEIVTAPTDNWRTTVRSGGNELEICRAVNGMWQTSSAAWGKVERDQAVEAMVAHFDAGLTTFDMADIYGPAEELYGKMQDYLRRERGEGVAAQAQGLTKLVPPPQRMTRSLVEGCIRRSCKKMQVSTLDMVQFHWWDYSTPGYLDALMHLTDLKEEGKIRTIALTNFDTRRLQEILENGIPIASNQVQHSLVDMRPQQKMAELCAMTGVKLITYGTVLGGLLSEKYLGEREPGGMFGATLTTPSQSKYKRMIDAWGGWLLFQDLLEACKTVGDKHGAGISTVGVRFILDQPTVAGSMVGVRFGISDHISATKDVFALKLDEEDVDRIESVISRGRDLLDIIGDCGDEYRG